MSEIRRKSVEGPTGGAGLIRYFDVDEGGPKLNPKLIISIVVAVIILEVMSTFLLK